MALTTNIVAPVGGLLILAGGLTLAFYTGTNGSALVETRAKAVEKYVAMTERALAGQDMKMAEKYAAEALAVDPKNTKALAEFTKVILASCPKTAAPTAASASETPKPAAPAETPRAQPAKPTAEAEEEMGCI